ncbi:MAG: hypothetical protein RBR97_17925 [Bacteroidales bacterium]|jgi:hypothetical protein|nr:hypothetical protein [Bacteroidales bacterium]
MKSTVEYKLKQIKDIWNNFILDYEYCSKKIKSNRDIKSNYLGDILGYFNDTIDIVFVDNYNQKYPDKFGFTISFLQAIYVHQDFIQEMLEVFKTGIEKGELKNDPSYSINRNIRNELVGHPIRKIEGKLISSTLFSYQAKNDEIQYLRYHIDNNFDIESKTYKILEIQIRHREFLEKYLDIILEKLKIILNEYLNELKKLENVIKKGNLETIIKLVELYFESFFEIGYLYKRKPLTEICKRRSEHIRYERYITKFLNDLTSEIQEKRNYVREVCEPKQTIISLQVKKKLSKIKFATTRQSVKINNEKPVKENYIYELDKIATRRNPSDFEFFGGMLRVKCKDNHLIINELEHMKNNIYNEIEYYTSYNLICEELDKEKKPNR